MVWTSLRKFVKADSRASKTSKVWIHCRSHCGNSCTKVFTILGFVALPTEGKPLCSHLTISALRSLSQNWWLNFAPGMWTWTTSWRHTNHAPLANTSTRKKLRNTWPRKSPNLCNRGYPRNQPPTMPANNAFWSLKLNWPRSNRRTTRPYPQPLKHQGMHPRPLDELYMDSNPPQHLLIHLACWCPPGSVDPWLVDNQPSSLTETQYKKWLKDLKLPSHKQETLEKQLEKVATWWNSQQDDAVKTIQRASVAMGIDPCKHKNASTDEIVLIKVMTVAMLMHS